jgi:hypothetical protein
LCNLRAQVFNVDIEREVVQYRWLDGSGQHAPPVASVDLVCSVAAHVCRQEEVYTVDQPVGWAAPLQREK